MAAGAAWITYKAKTSVPKPPPTPPVAAGKTRICVTGYTMSPPTAHAHNLAALIAKKYPDQFETWYYFDNFCCFSFMQQKFDPVPFPAHLKGHSTSPFVWFETSPNVIEPIGGNDHFSAWAKTRFASDSEIAQYAAAAPTMSEMMHAGKNPATVPA